MAKIKFQIDEDTEKKITPCPFLELNSYGEFRYVGSLDCKYCPYYLHNDFPALIVECEHP